MSFELVGGLSIPAERYTQALLDTLAMVSVSAGMALVVGIPLAVLLIVTAPGGFLASPRINRAVGSVVNGFRATPFIVLLVALIPFTRLVAGTTIGVGFGPSGEGYVRLTSFGDADATKTAVERIKKVV